MCLFYHICACKEMRDWRRYGMTSGQRSQNLKILWLALPGTVRMLPAARSGRPANGLAPDARVAGGVDRSGRTRADLCYEDQIL